MQFSEFRLHPLLLKTIDHLGFTQATEIQQFAIPSALQGADLIASSKTGSGKTLAYLLPLLNRLFYNRALSKRDPRGVILAPTRELANQVYAQVRLFTANTQYSAAKLIGGDNFNDQAKKLRSNPKIIVATPGRLADHLSHRHVFLNGLEMLVFDEADRMLDLGFIEQLTAIHKQADHRKRQTLMFSATMDNLDVVKMGQQFLNQPKRIAVGEANQPHQDIQQSFYLSDGYPHKLKQLAHLVSLHPQEQIIVFTATRDSTQELAKFLQENGKDATFLSGDMTQAKRNQELDGFARGRSQVLISTDVASRGLDLRNVGAVINFDLPKFAEEYVHRIGRTGRAGFKGVAYSLVSKRDWPSFELLQAFLQQSITFENIEGLAAKFNGIKPQAKNESSQGKDKKSSTSKAAGNRKKTVSKPKKQVNLVKPKIDLDAPPMRKK
ncbi:RNA helicase [Saccharobesus litoralis]|uniref:RNA helicase n=1 Tax=Saccharobesus litoralis TaxID=2172099 RepID=A0A2S0VRC2_9ALTE|nr:DEAD/DEAH box helicase [Saccharobesus litoralis]AWB66767.1 RNA helicase [Saccharobesus litoralis]